MHIGNTNKVNSVFDSNSVYPYAYREHITLSSLIGCDLPVYPYAYREHRIMTVRRIGIFGLSLCI